MNARDRPVGAILPNRTRRLADSRFFGNRSGKMAFQWLKVRHDGGCSHPHPCFSVWQILELMKPTRDNSSLVTAPGSQSSSGGVSLVNETELLFFENLSVGDVWYSAWRDVTGDDVAEFAVLTGDDDPLHTSAAADSPFGRPVAHGLLGLSLMAGLSSQAPKVATLALTEISDWRFEKPIFFGDQVRVMTQVEAIAPHGRRAGRVVWMRQLLNQDDRVVQQGRIVSLVSRGERLRKISGSGEASAPAPR